MKTRDIEKRARALLAGIEYADLIGEPNEEGEIIGSCYLGTIMNLTPSGKFYTPWANSNVPLCPHCKGKGSVLNPNRDPMKYAEALEKDHQLRTDTMEAHGAWCEGHWPKDAAEKLEATAAEADKYKNRHLCKFCGGTGSREAYEDEVFNDTLDDEASKKGGWIQSGKGDPCDLYFCKYIEKKEEEE